MANERLYLTTDLRAAAGIPRTTMNFYLREGLITPTERSASDHLLFDARQRDRLLRIVGLRRQGYTLKEIKRLLEAEEDAPR